MDIIQYDNGTYGLAKDTVSTIIQIEKEIKKLKEIQDQYKEQLLNQMEEKDIIKIDIPELMITRVGASQRETFDSKAFREAHRDLYDEYVNFTDVKSSVRIKVKDE